MAELDSCQEFELVREEPSPAPGSGYRATSSSQVPVLSQERLDILSRIGLWLRSCLNEEGRGLSGRDLLPEGNGYYLAVRSFRGEIFDPVRVFDSCPKLLLLSSRLAIPGILS